MEVKELQELIELERATEDKVRKAKEEAQEIVKRAREKAESGFESLESDPRQQELRRKRKEETERKKEKTAEEYKQKTSELNKTAEQNFEKAVAFLMKEMLRVEI